MTQEQTMQTQESKALFEMMCVGTIMSNILFNISQDEKVPTVWREHAKKRQLDWDKCIAAYNKSVWKKKKK